MYTLNLHLSVCGWLHLLLCVQAAWRQWAQARLQPADSQVVTVLRAGNTGLQRAHRRNVSDQ